MKLNRWVTLAALALFAAGLSRADVVDVTVNLNDVPTVDGGSWGSDQPFNVQTNPDEGTGGFYQSGICTIQTDSGPEIVAYDIDGEDCGLTDASIRVNNGGDAPGFPDSLSSDEAGGGVFGPYDADGVNSVLFTTTYPQDSSVFDPGQGGGDFQCSSNYYSFCGFQLSGDDVTVSIIFADPTSTVPEPSYGVVFLTATGLLIWARRSRRAMRI
jgi:hypothetical protein